MDELVIDYAPRQVFVPYHANRKRFSVTVAHRRAGKTVARVNKLIRSAVECDKRNPRFGYIAPFFVQAKEIAWLYLQHFAAPLLAHGGKKNESELSIALPHNNAVIRLYGAENAERIRGLYFDGIVVDEAQGIPRSTLSAIILPALSDRMGWLDCSGTPRGWTNLLGELVKIARSDQDHWYLQILKASETGIIPAQELAQQRALMSDNEYAQEFECDFEAAITGAVYGREIAEATAQERITAVMAESNAPINTAWDLGYDDATAIWWWQSLPGEIRVLDYYESAGRDIEHYCGVIKSRGYDYHGGKHYVPHDAAAKLLAAGGRSIVQQAHGHGVTMFVLPPTSQQNAIEATRLTLKRCWFDGAKCERGLDALKQYQFEFDTERKIYRSTPRHDWASHGADAFEIIGQVWRQPSNPEARPTVRWLNEATAAEVFDLQNQFAHESAAERV